MTVHEVLRQAIAMRRCVRLRTTVFTRYVCPYALGIKDGRPRVLVFQYAGWSLSGLGRGGQWRAFFVGDIAKATPIDGNWHTGPNLIAKMEACLDRVEYSVNHEVL